MIYRRPKKRPWWIGYTNPLAVVALWFILVQYVGSRSGARGVAFRVARWFASAGLK